MLPDPPSEARSQMAARGRWRGLLGLVLSLVLLAWVFYVVPWEEMLRALAQVRPAALVGSAVLFLLALATRARAWQVLLGPETPYMPTLAALLVGFLVTNVVPLRLGELARVVVLHEQTGIPWSLGLASVFLSRLVDAGLLALVALALTGFIWPEAAAALRGVLVAVAFALGLLALVLGKREVWIARLTRWEAQTFGPWSWLARGLNRVLNLFALWTSPRVWAEFLFWELVTWGLLAWELDLLLRVWFPDAAWYWSLWLTAVTSLGTALPSVPGHVGTMEAAGLAAFVPLTTNTPAALALLFTQHALYYLLTFLPGLLALVAVGLSWNRLWRTLQSVVQREKPCPDTS